MTTSHPLTQSALESYLWGAATLLRGTIDAGDYKQFIFPLLFYKRLCDVYDEELADALKESGGDQQYAELPEQHRFQIPAGAHWKVTRTKVKNVGKAIQNALRDIEKANPEFPGLYPVLQQQFLEREWSLIPFVNREQDLGIEGLRRSKLSYHPEYMVNKFRLIPK